MVTLTAIENELQQKPFVGFTDWFYKKYPMEEERKAFLDTQFSKPREVVSKIGLFCKQLKTKDTRYTLGNMHFILNLIYKPNGNTLQASELLHQFREFAFTVYNDNIINKAFLDRLKNFINTFRNEAAHTEMLSKEEALACKEEVRGIVRELVEGEVGGLS